MEVMIFKLLAGLILNSITSIIRDMPKNGYTAMRVKKTVHEMEEKTEAHIEKISDRKGNLTVTDYIEQLMAKEDIVADMITQTVLPQLEAMVERCDVNIIDKVVETRNQIPHDHNLIKTMDGYLAMFSTKCICSPK